jgi:hypothetical protein
MMDRQIERRRRRRPAMFVERDEDPEELIARGGQVQEANRRRFFAVRVCRNMMARLGYDRVGGIGVQRAVRSGQNHTNGRLFRRPGRIVAAGTFAVHRRTGWKL